MEMTFRTGITPNINAVKLTNFESRITPVPRRVDPPRVTTGWSASAEPPVPRFDPSAYSRTRQGVGPTTPVSRYDGVYANPSYPRYANGEAVSRYGSAYPVSAMGQHSVAPVQRIKVEARTAESPPRLTTHSQPPQLTSRSNVNCGAPSFSPHAFEGVPGPLKDEFARSPAGSIKSEVEADLEEDGEVEDDTPFEKRSPNHWIFTKEHMLERTPSRLAGTPASKELLYRQEAAGLIYAMGRELNLRQLSLHTATAYMHRFYMLHPFTSALHWKPVSVAALFLACKIEEEPQSANRLVKASCRVIFNEFSVPEDPKYQKLMKEMLEFENMLMQTLGFEFKIEHPHAHVASFVFQNANTGILNKPFMNACYSLATKSLCYTTLTLEMSSKVVACICIHACAKQWKLNIPKASDGSGRDWFQMLEPSLTFELLDKCTNEFLEACRNVPDYMKQKFRGYDGDRPMTMTPMVQPTSPRNRATSPISPSPYSPESNDSGKGTGSGSG